jgi:hypothetical protein
MNMKPKIDGTQFGSITIDGSKSLSKRVYGTSHTVSLDEAKHVYEDGAERLIVGMDQHGNVALSDEAAACFRRKGCEVELESTPAAARTWNKAKGAQIGLFHVTC